MGPVTFARDVAPILYHQGMSLLAACNLLFDHPMQHYFHAEPRVMATELLLDERVPNGFVAPADLGELAFQEVAGAGYTRARQGVIS